MKIFNTLLLREWLQYKRGWIGLVAAPMLLLLVLVPISQVNGLDAVAPEPIAVITGLLTVALVMAIALSVSGYQLMGLGRRDQQDRSIEFWASLPGSHSASLGAPILAHGLLMPMGAMAVAVCGGLVVGVAMAFKELGAEGIGAMQWSALFEVAIWLTLRLAVGIVLAALWLSPIVLALMAASAWLKRWGAPLLVIAVSGFLKLYQHTSAADAVAGVLARQFEGVGRSFFSGTHELKIQTGEEGRLVMEGFYDALYQFPTWARQDIASALQFLAQPQFLVGLAVAAFCFWLLVLQRKRGI